MTRLAVLAGALAALGAVAGPAGATLPAPCNGDWRLCGRTLDRVVLPATHNSMSNAADGWQIPNQQVGIPAQLAAGVRGFLIDTYYAHRDANGGLVTDPAPTPASQLYLCHVSCSLGAVALSDALRGIRRFLHDHPRNVLVFINEDYTRPVDFAREVRLSGLRKRVYGGPLGSSWPTLRKLIRQRRQIVMLSQGDGGPFRWYHNGYAGLLQETPYNWDTPDMLTDSSRWVASCRPNRGGTVGGLFLLNHWSPPVAPSPATSAQVNATDTLVGRAKVCAYVRGRFPTLVAVDMFQSGGLFEAVRQLNALL
ncbi:MAG: hypothetical protein QOI45_124 [Thermoleophilaceae bacterium]|nr:hypothetical protein [Thermoleophilaceae bacterium]